MSQIQLLDIKSISTNLIKVTGKEEDGKFLIKAVYPEDEEVTLISLDTEEKMLNELGILKKELELC